jgi:hypothetical protein
MLHAVALLWVCLILYLNIDVSLPGFSRGSRHLAPRFLLIRADVGFPVSFEKLTRNVKAFRKRDDRESFTLV